MTKHALLALCLVLIASARVDAACTGSSPNWTSTIDETSLNTCINTNAVAGDTITVTAGSASWGTNGLSVSQQPSNISVNCATQGACSVTGAGFYVYRTHGFRFSGFVFTCTSASNVPPNACIGMEGTNNFRIDHNTVNNADWANPLACIWVIGSLEGSVSNDESYGLIDHNTLSACRMLTWGEWGDTGGRQRWFAHGNIRGTQYNVFLEDNTYTVPANTPGPGLLCNDQGRVLCNFTDGVQGGGYVARFNTVNNSYFEIHPPTGAGGRGQKNAEIYHNTLTVAAAFQPNFSRPVSNQGSGSGVIFNNSSSGNYSNGVLSFNYIKRAPTSGENGSGERCTGSHVSDENQNAAGYACLDQIGVAYDNALMSTSTSVGQAKQPFYSWSNTQPNGQWQWDNGGASDVDAIIIRNRDFYEYNPLLTFDGTKAANRGGVGVGVLASRPATCATGVGWWATNVGAWNRLTAAADGMLYVCTATNVWTPSYVPYTYPHPRQGDAGVPDSPTNPRVG